MTVTTRIFLESYNVAVTSYLYFRDTSMFSGLIYKFNDHFKKKIHKQPYVLQIGCRPKYMNMLVSIFNLISKLHLIHDHRIKIEGS